MGFMDKLKSLIRGKEAHVKTGIDKAADAAQKVVPDQHDAKVDQVAEKAKGMVDDMSTSEPSSAPAAAAPPPAAPPPASPTPPPAASSPPAP